MKLKNDIKFVEFLRQINDCKEDVIFYTNEGDMLNLKSTLSQLVFAVITDKPEIVYEAEIKVSSEEDRRLLERFLVD